MRGTPRRRSGSQSFPGSAAAHALDVPPKVALSVWVCCEPLRAPTVVPPRRTPASQFLHVAAQAFQGLDAL